MTGAFLFLVLLCVSVATVQASKAADVPTFPLYNTAVAGLTTPAIGIGLGGYGSNPAVGYGGYPECFADANGCDIYSRRAVQDWLELGGRRLDCSNIYGNDRSVGEAIARSGVQRSELFILEKTGPGGVPLGYNDTMAQFQTILDNLRTTYVDLLLIHWPTQEVPQSKDAYCRMSSSYDERKCRLSTWQAMLDIFDSGRARAVGVSNFNITHLQEIKDAGMRLPSVNQCPFNLYRSSSQQQLRDYCQANNITFWGYSPLGVPDFQIFPANAGMAYTPMADPQVMKIAMSHKVTPAQVLIQWQYALGIPIQPRSQNAEHMRENLNSYSFTLTQDEMRTLSSAAQDMCSKDGSWYECAVRP